MSWEESPDSGEGHSGPVDGYDEDMSRAMQIFEDFSDPVPYPIDWPEFWGTRQIHGEFLIPMILPRGRHAAIFAKAKQGKSLLALDIAASMATGRSILGVRNKLGPRSVVYLDMEMSECDVQERLGAFGYGPEVDLTELHYFLMHQLPPLD